MTTPQKTNGPLEQLPPDAQKIVESGMVKFQEVAAESIRLRKLLDERLRDTAQDKVELEALRSLVAHLESRASSLQAERDQAVADRAVYESLFISIDAQLRAFNVPVTPVIKKLLDAVNAQQEATDNAKQADQQGR